MKFTNEQLVKAKAAKSPEEFLALVKENGIDMTEEEATKLYAEWHKEGELSNDELDNVSGGCGGKKNPPQPKYHVGQILWVGYPSTRTFVRIEIKQVEFYQEGEGWRYYVTNHYGYDENYYLETHNYIMTTDPGQTWPFK